LNLLYIPVLGLWGGLTNTTWKGRKVKTWNHQVVQRYFDVKMEDGVKRN
jgi:hypothetical protein